jgi:methylthioribose-1-phosphate isomerase
MLVNGKPYRTIWKEDNIIRIIDQRKLPHSFEIEELKTVDDVYIAIKDMHVRGAPLIGVCAAYGMYLACVNKEDIEISAKKLKSARPTAIDLMWAVDKMHNAIKSSKDKEKTALLLANSICEDSVIQCRKIGEYGLNIIEDISKKKKSTVNILTHCNAGWLATVDFGTATSPIYLANKKGIDIHVWVDETRPRNQGFLTAWELGQEGINHTIIADNTGGHLMQKGMVDMVLVGSDRTTSKGDVTNKIGTYLKALAANDSNIPFYVALPSSSIDFSIKDSSQIPIEKRSSEEMEYIHGIDEKGQVKKLKITPKNSSMANYAFDITPARLVTALITERGVCRPDELKKLFSEKYNER